MMTSLFNRPMLLFHTIRYLKPSQVVHRVLHAIRPQAAIRSVPRVLQRPIQQAWVTCAWRENGMLAPRRFRYIGHECEFATTREMWNHAAQTKLWLYNLHYFNDINAKSAPERRELHAELITHWIAENPPVEGNGWEPYCLSLRIVNWIKWFGGGGETRLEWFNSLGLQARYLRRRLEWHLLGNHLWANAKALIFAGTFFTGEEADEWRTCGLRILAEQLVEQVLQDGGHFERSPMYHAILLEDLLDLIQLSNCYLGVISEEHVKKWQQAIVSMVRWLQVMSHPDGDIALFNDAAFGIAARVSVLRQYAIDLGVSIDSPSTCTTHLAKSGYVRMQSGPAVLIADVGEIGPTYLPGHAHADTLSFELSLWGRRVLVDAGTSRYDICKERLWQRGTAAHNTVQINNENSSEVWSSFRVARRAYPLNVKLTEHPSEILLCAMHDGYRRLPGRPLHHRSWTLTTCSLVVVDEIIGNNCSAISRLRFHPKWRVEQQSKQSGVAFAENRVVNWQISGAEDIQVLKSIWHPEFGVSMDCQVLCWKMIGKTASVELLWIN